MTAPASTLSHPHRPLAMAKAPLLRDAAGDLGKYQFQVVTGNVADAVRSIGGLIFDRAMAGWEVKVVVHGEAGVEDRPLRILGARVGKRPADPRTTRPHLLAVAMDLMVSGDVLRRQVLALGDGNETEVLLWGRHHPTNLNRAFVAARHQPSAAAQVFKSHALAAGGVQGMHRADEGFYSLA